MAVQMADDVLVAVTGNPGTGTVTLGSRVTGYFDTTNLVNGTQYYYTIQDVDANGKPNGNTEIGYGTFTASGTTMSRDNVYTSITTGNTVSTSKINFSSGTQRFAFTCPAEFLNSVAPGGTVFNPSTVSWMGWYNPSNITPQTDNTALSSYPDSGSGGNTATQSGGARPNYRTGANGYNGVPLVQYASGSSQYMKTVGGGSWAGDFYMAAFVILQSNGSFENVLSGGDGSTQHKRRSLAIDPVGSDFYIAFIGDNSDVNNQQNPFMVVNTPYFIEVWYDGTNIWLWVNGVLSQKTTPSGGALTTPVSAVLVMGANPAFGENFNGYVGDAFFFAGDPSSFGQNNLRLWIAEKYGMFLNNTTGLYIPEITQTGTQQASPISDVGGAGGCLVTTGGLVVGGQVQQFTGGGFIAGPPYLNPATLTVDGIFTAVATGSTQEHMFVSAGSGINTLAIWNTVSYSVIRYLDNSGYECAAGGFDPTTNGSTVTGGVNEYGAFFLEASNIHNTSHGGCFVFVQTGVINGGTNGQYKRYEYVTNGNLIFYGLTVSSNTPPTILTLKPDGSLISGIGAGTFRCTTAPTNATATMSALTDLTTTLVAGRKYVGTLVLFANNSAAAEGMKFDFNGGSSLTVTSFEAGFAATPPGSGLVLGTLTATSISTALTATTATTADAVYVIKFTIVVNAGGTFIPRFAEVSHTTGTATVELGSYMEIFDTAGQ